MFRCGVKREEESVSRRNSACFAGHEMEALRFGELSPGVKTAIIVVSQSINCVAEHEHDIAMKVRKVSGDQKPGL